MLLENYLYKTYKENQKEKLKFNLIKYTKKLVIILFVFSIASIVISLNGCALLKSNGQTADINISAVEYLNPNVNGEASPIVVTFYQLKSPYDFKQANYHALQNNSAKVLSSGLIDKTTIEVRPGEHKKISLPISPNTQYIGIVAAYRDIDHAAWHTTVKLKSKKNKTANIHLVLESRALSTKKEYKSNLFGGIF